MLGILLARDTFTRNKQGVMNQCVLQRCGRYVSEIRFHRDRDGRMASKTLACCYDIKSWRAAIANGMAARHANNVQHFGSVTNGRL